MSLKKSIEEKRIILHQTNKQEIKNLFQLVERDLNDANIQSLSVDRKFATAYNAALQLATIILYAAGYRAQAKTGGHHWVTFQVLPEIMGKSQVKRSQYFDVCRGLRHITDYDKAGTISISELKSLLKEVNEFKKEVDAWLSINHPNLNSY